MHRLTCPRQSYIRDALYTLGMTQIRDEYEGAQTAFAEALAYELGMNAEDITALLRRDPVAQALEDLHAAWLQFSDEEDFGAELSPQDILDAMACEAEIDSADAHEADHEERQRMEEEAAWQEHLSDPLFSLWLGTLKKGTTNVR